ncbi:MAG: class I SAM-dependent methyltransferase [Brevundimonas sp.]|uniref:class I SAM-dependent methyltransferase n=1 Tax=Brevundimonas sp. TaxID=1871086 RepID=UPI002735A978|nr:class I SAM-dependent methyltransferase [Brevundimonas sp.]MDP3655582.1 class I SAM-dependent methyltransferase [Brevundimonas sp.]MDZ4110657.1 class I SAM-dependent methyltransferase [Brevundimonas sp.]
MSAAAPTPDDARKWPSIAAFLQFWLNGDFLEGAEKKEFDHYYGSYLRQFGPYVRHQYSEQTREISEEIASRTRPRLLEVGAGCGTESLWFNMLGATVTAIDLNTPRLDVARMRQEKLRELGFASQVKFEEASFFDFSPEEDFDLIWMEHTFHHLEPRAAVYAKILQLLKPGGGIFINEVNGWNPLLQLQFFLQRGFKTKTWVEDKDGNLVEYGNERITTPYALQRALRKQGFVVETVRRFRILPNLNPPKGWMSIEKALLVVFPFMATHFNIVAYKPDHV